MKFHFWKKDIVLPPVQSIHDHRILIEKDGVTELLSSSEIAKKFGIVYLPQLDFPCWADFAKISRKIAQFHKKGYLDHQQLWLGAYFQKEILSPPNPPVRLRFIDDTVGWGVFAEEDLKPLTFIGEYGGSVRRKKRADSQNAYCFQYAIVSGESTRFTIDARDQGGIVRFINHSASPNLMSALATHQNLSHIVLFAHRSIRKGEQLFYDYGPDYWHKRSKPRAL